MWSLLLTPIREDDAAAAGTTTLVQMPCGSPKVYLSIENYNICFKMNSFKMSLANYKDQSSPIKPTEIIWANKIGCKQVKQAPNVVQHHDMK